MGIDIGIILAFVFGLAILFVGGKLLLVPMKFIGKLLLNAVIGGIVLFVLNLVGEPIGLNIGINPFTALVVGILGIPGVILLIILSFLM